MTASTKSKSNLSSNNDGDINLWKELSENNSAVDEPHLSKNATINQQSSSLMHPPQQFQNNGLPLGLTDAFSDLAPLPDEKYLPPLSGWESTPGEQD